jgi:hypothetical protein
MQLSQPLVRLFDLPVDDLAAAMPDAGDPVWDIDKFRQTRHEVHRFTRSIIFCAMENGWVPGQKAVIRRENHAPPQLAGKVQACADRIAAHYSGTITRLVLAELAPQGVIAVHRDHGAGLTLVHRCHLPVVTNPGVQFFIDMIPHRLEAGTAYEFDNTRRHSVENHSAERRIHLLCDVMPAGLAADAL